MTKKRSLFLAVGLGLLLGAVSPGTALSADVVTKDARGRVLTRTATHDDRSRRVTSYQYGADSDQPVVVVEQDLDPAGEATSRVEQRFDGEGRLREKIDLRFDEPGKRT